MLIVSSVSASAAYAKSDKPAPADDGALIVQAKEAFSKGRLPELERIAAKTQRHLLAAWPDYWRLKLLIGLPQTDAAMMHKEVRAFLERHPEHPLRENAQRDWVNALAAKDLWQDLANALANIAEQVTSPQMACARARVRLAATGGALDDAQMTDLALGNESSDTCLALIDRLAKLEKVSPAYLRQRARWAAQIGSDSGYQKALDIVRVHAKAHDLGARGQDTLRAEALLGRILKLSRTDSLASYQTFRQHRGELSNEQRAYAEFAVGTALWRRSHPEAWALMQEGWESRQQQPDEMLQIAAREALRRNQWPRVLQAINAMREPNSQDPTWRYWRAVALKQTQQTPEGLALLATLRDDYGFYGLLARETLGERITTPAPQQVALTDKDRQRLNADRGMERSYTLLRINMRAEAVAEWTAAMRGRTDVELIRAALHAKEAGFLDRMIAAADRTTQTHDFTLRYPLAFQEAVMTAAQESSLDPWWVLGLIRQESRFIPNVKSSVGATGLMQIMPATGKMLAKNLGLKQPASVQLADINTNVRLGTTYMRQLQDRFGGSALLASAAYNAGPSRAVSWRANLPQRVDGAAFAESIPFAETRDYVKRVLANAVLYHAVHTGGPAPSLKRLLGEVRPESS